MTASANFNPELSVIVPVYNVAPYLRKCLDSILNQTFKNIEIIIVSDGPEEDNKICAEYAAKDSRIIFIKDIGKGLGGARNAGIDIARGKYIAFVDSDDWLEPETYERALNYNKDSDIIIFEANIVNPEKENWQDIEKYSQLNFKGLQKLDNEHILNTNVFAWNKIFKKDIIKQHNIRFPENMQYEDFPFFFHYSFVSQKAFYLKERLYNYTQRKNSGMSKTTSGQYTHIIDHLNGCYFLFEILKKSNAIAKHEKLFAEIYAKWIEIGLGYCQKTDKLNFCKTAYKICKKMQLKNYSIPLLKLLKKKRFKDIIDGLKKEKILYLFNFLPILTIKHYPSQTKKIFLFGLLPLAKLKKAQYNQEDKPAKMFYENKVFWENERIYTLPANYKIYLEITGSNNTIKLQKFNGGGELHMKITTNNSKIILGKNNTISPWAALQIITYNPPGKESHGTVIIGNNNCFNGNFLIIPGADEEMPIVIGNNNLFAGNIQCQAISHHLVFDMNTKKQLNTEKGIKIGNNNWFGQEVLMLNKASIPDNCVIGIRSLINKSFSQNNSLIAGSPATTKRNNIGWHEYLDSSYLHTVNPRQQLKG